MIRMTIIKQWLILITLLVISGLLCAAKPSPDHPTKPRILILNSYHPGYYWSDDELDGLRSVLPSEADLTIEYMDTKKYSNPSYYELLYQTYHYKYQTDSFDVLIALDNNALLFLLEHRSTLFPKTPLVFGGINNFDPEMVASYTNLTGVAETVDQLGTLEVALSLHPATERIVVISDHTTSGQANRANLEKLIATNQIPVAVEFLDQGAGLEVGRLTEQLSQLPSNSIVYYADFFQDKTGQFIEYEEVLPHLSAVSTAPIYVHADFYLGYGTVGGKLNSGFYQGQMVGQLTQRILAGESAADIPLQLEGPTKYMFDYHQLTRWQISQSALPPNSIVLNQPDSFYSHYRNYIWGAIGFIIIETLFIGYLLININQRRQAEISLHQSEARYSSLFHNNHAVMMLFDPQTAQIVDANSAACSFYGYSPTALTSRKISDLNLLSEEAVFEEIEQAKIEQRNHFYFQHRLANGEIRDVEVYSGPIYVDDKQLLYSIVHDITERRQTEQALQVSLEKYRVLFEAFPLGITITDEDGNLLEANKVSERLLGVSNEEHNRRQVDSANWQIIRSDGNLMSAEEFPSVRALQENRFVGNVEMGIAKQNNQVTWLNVTAAPIPLEGYGVAIVYNDITDRKQTEEALRKVEGHQAVLFSSLPIAYFISDIRETMWVSEQFETLTGFPVSCFTESPLFWLSRVHPEDHRRVLRLGEKLLVNGSVGIEFRWLCADGRYRWFFDQAVLMDSRPGNVEVFGIWLDITERKEVEQQVRQRNRELVLLNQVIAASTTDNNEPKTVLEIACRELALAYELPHTTATWFDKSKMQAVIIAEYLTHDQTSRLNHTLEVADNPALHYILTHKTTFIVEDIQEYQHKPAVYNFMQQFGIASLFMLPLIINGEVIAGLCLTSDKARCFTTAEINLALRVADQVAGVISRVHLNQERQRLSTAIEQAAEIVMITDSQGVILYVNPTFERVTGYSLAEAMGQRPSFLQSGQHSSSFYRQLWQTITAGKVWHGQLVNRKKNGSIYTAEVTISPVLDENNQIINYVGLQRDVTRELQLEAQYRHAQKMDAVGRLAGGVAHDFNNLLTAIMSYAGLALVSLPTDHVAYSDIEGVQHTAQRAANLTRQLLTFARRQVIKPTILDLNQLILGIDKMLRRLISADIELMTLPGEDVGQIKADAGQLEQVLVNLVINARDAMPTGGRLTIQTANVSLDRSYADHHPEVPSGEYVMLTVSDTGIGMTEEIQAHIFEPFFTTKESSQGTGLGLATCFGIVKQSGGHIWVYSEVGHGTTFKVYLPRLLETGQSAWPAEESLDLPSGTETILLVEDEAPVRRLASRILQQQGYQLLEAMNGQEALHLVRQQPTLKIDLLLTDVVMPQLGGKALADQLKHICPHIKVLFTSGYTDDGIVSNGILEVSNAFLQKPFTPAGLLHKVRQVLDQTE